MRVLGIDPGLANTGWSIVDYSNGKFEVKDYGTIKTKSENSEKDRIVEIVSFLKEKAISEHCDGCGAEDIFFVKNISSGISVAKVIGAFMYALSLQNVDVCLFTPTEIKKAIVGIGGADKEQIRRMVMIQTGMGEKIKSDHAADSVAAAITYITTYKMRTFCM